MTSAGKLDRRVRIETATEIDDGYNTMPGDWAILADVACQYIPTAGKEAREMQGQTATMPATFIVRYSERMKPLLTDSANFRVRFPATDSGQVFDIKGAAEVERRKFIHLTTVASD